ncbi:iron complex transport system ATP-binding protein [Hathewaya proteolytica DSM 3090]|uniref:Iron complex transport system ATP-binding protein n=1 Tax=Hathewaya proteolytica DSM 3090 TaxID=1121331 RepID=A0A1M6KMM5_9CLOT|nr:ABC transporter ATP-binding protein [Hathewaya proteolytica]SHJ60157.1 iron complex transport system ATP-binding protein [Hathewaya proteolytica DSM 3090]
MIMLETENLNVGYGKKVVVGDVNIKVKKGEILCLLGANGAGKTTTLRTISGLLNPMQGKVLFKGKDISHIAKKELAKKMALVLTSRFTGSLMTVYNIVSMGRYPHTGFFGKLNDNDKSKVFEALKTVNAENLIQRYFDELSDGEKQKVLVARALVQEPEIIILDEPTSHLDIKHRLELMEILKTLSKKNNIAVVLSLHEIDIALKSCDKVMLIKGNKVAAYGEPEDVVDEEILNGLYGLKNKNYNNLLGAIELKNPSEKKTFVVGGAGTAIPIFRALTKKEIGVYAAVLHENDVDYEIGRTMGIGMCTVAPFKNIDEKAYKKAIENLKSMDYVVDSGFPIGNINKENVKIICDAVEQGKRVYSLRRKSEGKDVFGKYNAKIVYKDSISCIVSEINGGVNDGENL